MIAVIGDIHGCLNTLKELVNDIKTNYPGIPIFTVGDLIDRGRYGAQVIDFVKENNILFTPGNHDYMFYYYFMEPNHSVGKAWVYNGYESTINSYNNDREKMLEHLKIIASSPLYYNFSDCFISHAGISNYFKKSYFNNPEAFDQVIVDNMHMGHGILWTRDQLLNIGKLQIVGHTRHEEITYVKKSNVLYIDTSVYTGDKLSAVILSEGKMIDKLSVKTIESDL
jgi:serine/threonine protein phosphatase 1